jgi:uncharacterized protein YbjT (DUF2867 family)
VFLNREWEQFPFVYSKATAHMVKLWKRNLLQQQDNKILIFGGHSFLGATIVKELLQTTDATMPKPSLRVAVESGSSSFGADLIRSLGIEVVTIDFNDKETLEKAWKGITKTFLVLEADGTMIKNTSAFMEMAKEQQSQLKYIVLLSIFYIDQNNDTTTINASSPCSNSIYESYREAEALVSESGISYTILRCNLFMQHLLGLPIKTQGVFSLPLGEAKISWVDARDVASAVSILLKSQEETHWNKTYLLTGGIALTCYEIAEILSKIFSKRIQFLDSTDEDLKRIPLGCGIQLSHLDALLDIYRHAREGHSAHVTSDLQELLGNSRLVCNFERFARDHTSCFKDTLQVNRKYTTTKTTTMMMMFHVL